MDAKGVQTVVASLSGPNFAEEVKLVEGAAGCLQALAQGQRDGRAAVPTSPKPEPRAKKQPARGPRAEISAPTPQLQ